MTDRVWLAALRRGIAHHDIDGRHTTCRRYIGEIGFGPAVRAAEHGWVAPLHTAEKVYHTRPCARCYGTAKGTPDLMAALKASLERPSRDRRPA
jgi:hypothetical protein